MKKRVNISIDDKTLFIIDKMAEDRGIDRSTMITLCIREKDRKDGSFYCLEFDKVNFMNADYYRDLALDTPRLKAVFDE